MCFVYYGIESFCGVVIRILHQKLVLFVNTINVFVSYKIPYETCNDIVSNEKATKMLHEWIFMLWFIPRSIVHSWAAVMFPHKSIFEKMWIHKKYEEKKTNIVIYLYLRQFNLTAAQWLHFLPIFVIQSLYFLDMLETTLFMLPFCYAEEQQYRMFFSLPDAVLAY